MAFDNQNQNLRPNSTTGLISQNYFSRQGSRFATKKFSPVRDTPLSTVNDK